MAIKEFLTEEEYTLIKRLESLINVESSNTSRGDVDDEGEVREPIGLLGPNADNTQIINKLNEIITSFNKSLSDYRV